MLRGARWSELLFAFIALLVALGLPTAPADVGAAFLIVHWYAMVVVAFGLVVALRRPTPLTWAATTVLCVYFLANALLGFVSWWIGTSRGAPSGSQSVLPPLLVGMAAFAQLSVAIRCWQARAIWAQRGPTSPSGAAVVIGLMLLGG